MLLWFMQRGSSDNKEASVILSGMFSSICLCIQLFVSWSSCVKKTPFSLGALDFLQKPVVALVRLSDSVVMESALESPIPIRFVFVLVGPSQSNINYSECGRAMGALMADWVREKLPTAPFLPPTDE